LQTTDIYIDNNINWWQSSKYVRLTWWAL